jgi:TonB family protein
MAFRALLFSKSPETNAAMTAACKRAEMRAEVCSDIFTAIEKGKTKTFSCVIADWADQPEASFLLKRARESAPNRKTVAIAIVDHDPTPAELRDNRLDFLIYRPISPEEAHAVLGQACERMEPVRAEDAAELSGGDDDANGEGASAVSPGAAAPEQDAPEPNDQDAAAGFPEANAEEGNGDNEIATVEEEDGPRKRHYAAGFRAACAVLLALTAAFYLWQARAPLAYLARTREGRVRVLRESAMALIDKKLGSALPTASDAPPDAYYSRSPANSNAQTAPPEVIAAESTLPEARQSLPKAADLPLPVPVFESQEAAPVRRERAAIPESMRNSAPMARPEVVTVNPAQMMPVSAPQPQAPIQPFSEPVAVSEEAARALLVHAVNPVYPPEALAQKLHGSVVLQAVVGRDGGIEDLKLLRGNFVLGRAAIAAVKQWRFQPYNVSGHAASTQTTITVDFSYPPG